ncbi:MAG: prepilin-type N-terminal cleavage/methylation domain-containing protein [Deltaproteobacteria bacterium]|nr:prepilin-type N-terminal cleavage/methylation domain-containing protein [Deltaproteobacteria bacterium]
MRRKGFTYVELIVVLAILAGLTALVVPSFSRTIASARLRASASDVRSTFARARALAVISAQERSAVFDLSRGEFGVDNEAARILPETTRLGAVLPGGDRLDQGSLRIRFFPDGGGEEAEISVTAPDGGALRVTVDPLTGLAEAGT